MKRAEQLFIAGTAVLTLFLAGCEGGYYGTGMYEGPYYGDFGPYASDYGPFYGGDLAIGGFRYRNHFGGHHFYGHGFGARHFGGGFHGGGFHSGGFHGGGFHGGGSRH
jgi:hypothetical protein